MLSLQEKQHIKDILGDGLNINRSINFPYFLDAIESTNKNVKALKTELEQVLYNQRILEDKLNRIINLIKG